MAGLDGDEARAALGEAYRGVTGMLSGLAEPDFLLPTRRRLGRHDLCVQGDGPATAQRRGPQPAGPPERQVPAARMNRAVALSHSINTPQMVCHD
jgi:hypothetical protein